MCNVQDTVGQDIFMQGGGVAFGGIAQRIATHWVIDSSERSPVLLQKKYGFQGARPDEDGERRERFVRSLTIEFHQTPVAMRSTTI